MSAGEAKAAMEAAGIRGAASGRYMLGWREASLSLAADFGRCAGASPPDVQRAAFLACAAVARSRAQDGPEAENDAGEVAESAGDGTEALSAICTITRDQLTDALTRVRDTTALTVSPALATALWEVLDG